MKAIKIEGFTAEVEPDYKPAVCIYGEPNTGKTRFGCTMPHDEGAIGFLALDPNTKRTVREQVERTGAQILVPDLPALAAKDAIALARLDCGKPDEIKKIMETYTRVQYALLDLGMRLASSDAVESIAVDLTQLNDYILFAHRGRKHQLDGFSRTAPNQDLLDFCAALKPKNLCLMCSATETWQEVVDENGKKKNVPTGHFKPEGIGKLGGTLTTTCQLYTVSKKIAREPGASDEEYEEALLAQKYRIRVDRTKGNTLLEGQDLAQYGICGSNISWANLMSVVGITS